MFKYLLVLLISLTFLFGNSNQAQAANWYVSMSAGSDTFTGTTTSTPFKTIGKAVSVVHQGDVINVHGDNDVYTESVTVNVDNVTITGWFSNSKPILDGTSATTKIGFDIQGDKVTISNFSIRNFLASVSTDKGAAINTSMGKNSLVFSGLVIDNCNYGIYNLGSSDVQINNSIFGQTNKIVKNTGLSIGGNAIYAIYNASNGNLDANIYSNNTFYLSDSYAVYFDASGYSSLNAAINNNTFNQNRF